MLIAVFSFQRRVSRRGSRGGGESREEQED